MGEAAHESDDTALEHGGPLEIDQIETDLTLILNVDLEVVNHHLKPLVLRNLLDRGPLLEVLGKALLYEVFDKGSLLIVLVEAGVVGFQVKALLVNGLL